VGDALFVSTGDPQAADVVKLGVVLLWIAAGYQLFDGLQLGSGFALRGAGDVRVPAIIFFGWRGAYSCRSPTCFRSRREKAGSTGCRNSASRRRRLVRAALLRGPACGRPAPALAASAWQRIRL